MKFKDGLIVLFLIYLVINTMTLASGITKADMGWGSCYGKLERIEYVFPGFRGGCWLGSVPSKETR